MDAVVVPIRSLSSGKSRLTPRFAERARYELSLALLRDVIDLSQATAHLSWWVLSPDAEARSIALEAGLGVLEDPGTGLNPALSHAAAVLGEGGAASLTILPGDIPLASKTDVTDLLDTGATSDVVVVPSGDDGGTNALYLTPPDLIPPMFGASSLKAHLAEAERRNLRCSILALPRLALDLDTPEDVDRFLAHPRSADTHAGRFLLGR